MNSIQNINVISMKIPPELRDKMSPSYFLILDLLVSLMRSTSKRSPSKAFYSYPSQEWIANRLNYTRSYISECITDMVSIGLIDVTHRRKVSGRWQTNLYRVGMALARALNMVTHWITSIVHRVGKSKHLVNNTATRRGFYKEKDTFKTKSPPTRNEVMDYIRDLGHRLHLKK